MNAGNSLPWGRPSTRANSRHAFLLIHSLRSHCHFHSLTTKCFLACVDYSISRVKLGITRVMWVRWRILSCCDNKADVLTRVDWEKGNKTKDFDVGGITRTRTCEHAPIVVSGHVLSASEHHYFLRKPYNCKLEKGKKREKKWKIEWLNKLRKITRKKREEKICGQRISVPLVVGFTQHLNFVLPIARSVWGFWPFLFTLRQTWAERTNVCRGFST